MDTVRLVKWDVVCDRVLLEYSDGDVFSVLKSDFDRAFGPIVSGSKEQIRRDFAISE